MGRWLARSARAAPYSPNEITLAALLLNLIAAVTLLNGPAHPIGYLIAVLLLGLAGVFDAFDGVVARVQNKATPFGDFLDHVCDRLSDTALAVAWLWANGVVEWLLVTAVVAVMMNGYIGTQLEATFGEREYETLGRGEFVLAMLALPIISYVLAVNGWQRVAWHGFTVAEWISLFLLFFAILGIVQRVIVAARMERR
jgi:phosphatidylglycerophosphate synthase